MSLFANLMGLIFKHPLTDAGLKRFLGDWNEAGLSIFPKA